MTEWYERWFGEEYLRLYPHRDEEDAARLLALLARHVPIAGARVLDLACGVGRHAALFAARGARVVGFDLSMPLLAVGHRRYGAAFAPVRGDMRALPFCVGAFDLVANLFTSFGYFTDDREHERVVREAARVLRPGGTFVLDYLNAAHVVASLVPRETQEMGSHQAAIERRVSADRRYVIKDIRLLEDGRRYQERVRLFTPEELERLFRRSGLHVQQQFGDYDGGPLERARPRAIFLAART